MAASDGDHVKEILTPLGLPFRTVPRARLRFPSGEQVEFDLEEVIDFGPPIGGFRAWLGAVNAAREGRWVVRFADGSILGFRREELRRVRGTEAGAELSLGDEARALPVREADVLSYGPEPEGVRPWLGRLAHGRGEAWVRLRDGRELLFPIGGGPHVVIVDPRP